MNCRSCMKEIDILLDLSHIPISISGDCRVVKKGVIIYKCMSCNFIQKMMADDIQKDNFKTFSSSMLSERTEQTKFIDGKQMPRSELIINGINNFFPEYGKILDIGTGNGAFLKAFKKYKKNWELYAQDIHSNFKNDIISLIGIENRFFEGDINKISGKFDIVSLNHVLVHIVELHKFIEKLHKLMENNGNIIIQINDTETNFFDMVIMDHINHFSKQTLFDLLKKEFRDISFFNIIPREISVVIGKNVDNNKMIDLDIKEKVNIEEMTKKLEIFINYIHLSKEMYIVFGTAPFSIYMGALLGDRRLINFIDEDSNKIGKVYLNKNILKPINKITKYKIILPFSDIKIINNIKNRYLKLEFITCYDVKEKDIKK